MKVVVGMADMKAAKGGGSLLVTYSLGSCIAVMAIDATAQVGGLLHFMLPDSGLDAAKSQKNPLMFADTGIEQLLDALQKLGAVRRRISIKLAGGASVLDASRVFNIGERNFVAARKRLWKEGLLIEAEDVGGTAIRTVELDLASGRAQVKTLGQGMRSL